MAILPIKLNRSESVIEGSRLSLRFYELLDRLIDRSGSGIQSIVAGNDIGVDNSDPDNPIVSYTGTDFTDIIAQLQKTFSWKFIPADENITIADTQQMVVVDGITIDGTLDIEGEIALI